MEPNNSPKKDLQSAINAQIGLEDSSQDEIEILDDSSPPDPSLKDLPSTELQKEFSTVPETKKEEKPKNIPSKDLQKKLTGIDDVNKDPEKVSNEIVSETSPSNIITPKPSPQDNLPPLESTTTMPQVGNMANKKPGIIPTHPDPVPEIPKEPVQEKPKEMTPADNVQLDTLRTYKADINSTVNRDKITTAKVLISEQKKKEKEEAITNNTSIESPVNKFKVGLSVILISVAIIAILFGTFLFLAPKPGPDEQQSFVDQSELSFDGRKTFLVTGKSANDVQNEINTFLNSSYAEGTISELILYLEKEEEGVVMQNKLSVSNLFNVLKLDPPITFTRNLSSQYIFGVYTLNSDNKEFLLFKVEDFGNVYSSIFDYEGNLVSQIRKIFGGFEEFDLLEDLNRRRAERVDGSVETSIATSTATSTSTSTATSTESVEQTSTTTEPVQKIDLAQQIKDTSAKVQSYSNFVDLIIQNNDARAILTPEGEILFYYAFIDDKWLLFSDDVEVLKELKRRIREKNLVR